MVKRILAGVAGADTLPGEIGACVDLARRHGASITIVSIIDAPRLSRVGPVPPGAAHYARGMADNRIERSRERDEADIAPFVEACEAAGVACTVARKEGDAIAELTDLWRYHDLCVLSARAWFDHGVGVDRDDGLLELIASGVRPILAVTQTWRPVKRALIAYSGSVESAKAMKRFVQLGLWGPIEFDIVCVEPSKSGEDAAAMLDHAADYCELHGHRPVVARLSGDPPDALLAHAARVQADVIVLGASHRTALLRKRFGVNARKLLDTSPIPLFLCH